jgi:glycosyltransferase involved in cell wall biosynthesis
MRILIAHNYYQQRGGEDESTEQEVRLLQAHGHDVRLYARHNDDIKAMTLADKGRLFFSTTWSSRSYRAIKQVLYEFHPDIVHVQNFFPLITPAIHYACRRFRIPVVQSLRNYRLFCANGLFLRQGRVCEECLQHSLWRGIRYGCYRHSRIQSGSVALMLATHRAAHTWHNQVTMFMTLTEFARRKCIEGGIPATKIVVRPNFLEDDPGTGDAERESVLLIGRLSQEKGIAVLLEAWRRVPHIPLKIIGSGPLEAWARAYINQHHMHHVELLGYIPLHQALELLKQARFLVMPSVWYETFGRTIIEAYATATPVIASRIGALAEIVADEHTGLLFEPGNVEHLVAQATWLWQHPQRARAMGAQARQEYETRYTAKPNYRLLMELYARCLDLEERRS